MSELSDPRHAIGQALSTFLTQEQVNKLIEEILAIEKRVSVEVYCKHCRKVSKVYASVPDAKSVADALANLATQAFGRPGEARDDEQQIIFKRLTRLEEIA